MKHTSQHQQVNRYQRGSSLLEVMIALFVLAIGMLGYVGLITSGITINQRAFSLSQATFLAEDLVDRARSNRGVIADYKVLSGTTPSTILDCDNSAGSALSSVTTCTEAEMAEWDLAQWWESVNNTLSNADATVTIDTTSNQTKMTITLNYSLSIGREGTGDEGTLTDLEQYQLVTEI